MRRFLCTLGFTLTVLITPNMYATSGVFNESNGYTIKDNSKDLWLSRDGGKSFKVKNGDIINKVGDYSLIDKEDNTYTQFSIMDSQTRKVNTVEELEEELYQGLRRHDESFTLTISDKLTIEDIKSCLKVLPHKYPLLDYAGCTVSRVGNKLTLKVNYLLEHEDYVLYTNKVKSELNNVIRNLDLSKEDVELELELVRWLIDRATYYKSGKDVPKDSITHMVQGLGIGEELVCDGYAKTLMYLLNNTGIPTDIIRGTTETGRHAWNIVQLGQEYYHVDATWSDTELGTGSDYLNYFNEKDSFMEKTHSWEHSLYPKCVGNTYYNLNNFEFVDQSLDNFTYDHSILVDSGKKEQVLNKLSSKLKSGFSYYTYDKYGKTIITLSK